MSSSRPPTASYVPMAKKLAGGSDGAGSRFEVDLSRAGNAEELKGKS